MPLRAGKCRFPANAHGCCRARRKLPSMAHHRLPLGLEPSAAKETPMFIQTEATPNPATLKFLPGRPVLPDGALDIPDAADAAKSPLAERLFAIPNVAGGFFGSDF